MSDATLTAAYRRARNGYRVPAAAAWAKARDNWQAFRDARATYETAAAIRDAAREEANAAKLAASVTAREGGPAYEAAAQEVTERVAALDAAERAKERAQRHLAHVRGLCTFYGGGDYGAVTWQGGDESAPAAALPFTMPPAMRSATWAKGYARHMQGGGRGGRGHLFALMDSAAVRDTRDAHDVARLNHTGWYDNPHGESFRDGSGLCLGVVALIRGRDGSARFLPGYRFGGQEDSGTFDARNVYTAERADYWNADAWDSDAARAAAHAADSMAEHAAEEEKAYQAAAGAGHAWAEKGEELVALRGQILAALKERRDALAEGMAGRFPALCDAIRAKVADMLATRAELIRERAELAEGDDSTFYFYPDADARAAFCDAAGLDSFPA